MVVLTVNAGSSSIRLAAFALEDGGPVRRAGSRHERRGQETPAEAVRAFLGASDIAAVDAVAHRVVHGGASLIASRRIDRAVEGEIERLSPLAPLHNPVALAWIRGCRALLGEAVPQVAVFDTAFFASLPAVAGTYALPHAITRGLGLRRFGFHGMAHAWMWRRWRALRPDLPCGGRVVSFQLGAGCSAAAIAQGLPRDTSMGFSPLEGLVMATRAGDVDPGLLTYLLREQSWSAEKLEHVLNDDSGLLGVSGSSGDVRALLELNDPDARLALDLYGYRARKYLGAYLAALGGADGVLFGGGVGEHAPAVRARILRDMAWCGIALDPEANAEAMGREARISAPESQVAVWVVPVDEESLLVREAQSLIGLEPGRGRP